MAYPGKIAFSSRCEEYFPVSKVPIISTAIRHNKREAGGTASATWQATGQQLTDSYTQLPRWWASLAVGRWVRITPSQPRHACARHAPWAGRQTFFCAGGRVVWLIR
jgi:hypothetical protein